MHRTCRLNSAFIRKKILLEIGKDEIAYSSQRCALFAKDHLPSFDSRCALLIVSHETRFKSCCSDRDCQFVKLRLRAHIFEIFVVRIVLAACPVSFATVTKQGAAKSPSGTPPPSPLMIASSTLNPISNGTTRITNPSSATASASNSSVA